MTSLGVVPTGIANLASVLAAFRRLGVSPNRVETAEEVETADRVVVPGVGSFGAAMAELRRMGVAETLGARVADGRPTLAVCVGMQVLAGWSEESPGTEGLGVIPQMVRRFGADVHVPQLGWNLVEPGPESALVERGWAYFANSYRIAEVPSGWSGAGTDHGAPFVSALERGDVLACQFHPELSGPWGSALLERWLDATAGSR